MSHGHGLPLLPKKKKKKGHVKENIMKNSTNVKKDVQMYGAIRNGDICTVRELIQKGKFKSFETWAKYNVWKFVQYCPNN